MLLKVSRGISLVALHQAMPAPEVAAEAPPPKRSRFSLDKCPKQNTARLRPPDMSKLSQEAKALPAPQAVRAMLAGTQLFIGIDVETHDLLPRGRGPATWMESEFGFLTMTSADEISHVRLLQLGWARSGVGAEGQDIKSTLIKPDGFCVQKAATDMHKITHADACERGVPLRTALLEFISDVSAAVDKGYRVCAHHLGFDAALIARELELAGLDEYKIVWDRLVRPGLCTMQPSIGEHVFKPK